jgi:hypothetical protein
MKNIETKFNVNDQVWVLDDKKARLLPIKKIEITIDDKVKVHYYINKGTKDNYECLIVNEKDCFTILDELIDNIKY